MQQFVVTGIGTGVGKTVVSAVLCEAMKAGYWKPVQAGTLEQTDSLLVKQLAPETMIIPERKLLSEALSPHESARIDGVELKMSDFELPYYHDQLIIEGAGGLMVPLNEDGLTYLDIFEQWKVPVYLVTRHYLGSINHTLMSLNMLSSRNITIAGLIVNGTRNEASERVYRQHFPELTLYFLPELSGLTPQTIAVSAQEWNQQNPA